MVRAAATVETDGSSIIMRVGAHLSTLSVCVALAVAWAGCGVLAPRDASLLTGQPCGPPCWQGLSAGVSTEEEVERFLATSGLVDRNSIYRGSLSRGEQTVGTSVQWRSAANVQGAQAMNSFDIEGGMLRDMTIYLDAEVALEQLLGRYGPPEKYLAALLGVHFTSVRVSLFYPEDGFVARVELPRDDASLYHDTNVASVWYFQSAPLDRFLELGRDIGHFSAGVEREALSDWQGYGQVQVQ
jgi:hypothetical protein